MANGNRKLEDWLKGYLQYTEGQESPDVFHLWCGISAIAAAMERRCFLDRGYYTLFPNLYVILVSGSAVARKSTAIGVATRLYKMANPEGTIFSQKMTPEALIAVLHEGYNKRKISSGYVVADELSVFLGDGARDAGLIQLLTKLYDCTDFDYHTLSRGKELCSNPCCNMIAGSAPDWLKTSLPAHAIGGGFTGRIVFVHHVGSGRRIAFPKMTPEMKVLREKLTDDLTYITKIAGEFSLTEDAHDWFEDWYVDVYKPDEVEGALKPYMARKPDTLLKVAMIVSISRGDSLEITEEDCKVAIDLLVENERFLPEMMRLIQSTEVGEQAGRVLAVIKRRDSISHSDLLRQVSYFANSKMVSDIIESLGAQELVKEFMQGNKRMYKVVR